MKSRLLSTLLLLPLLSGFFMLPGAASQVSAAFECQHGSTQARVHRDFSDPWKQDLTIRAGERFEAAGFHNHSGVLATDTVIQLVQNNTSFSTFLENTQGFYPNVPGEYTVYVNTRNQLGGGCSDQARLTVLPATTCQHASTQARVLKDGSPYWEQTAMLERNQGFKVASYHNNSMQTASDTTIFVTGPAFPSGVFAGNGTLLIPNVAGQYDVKVTTNNQSGAACEETARVWVR